VSQYLLILVLGLGSGAVYAGLGMGLVLTYEGTGFINFAAAAMATVALYVFSDLRAGRLTLPLPWIPSFDVGVPPTPVAAVVALVVAAAVGALVDVAVSRPLRRAPVVAKVVAAVGVMITLSAAVGLKYGTDLRLPDVVLPSGALTIGGFPVPVDRIWLLGLVVVGGAALVVWNRRSWTGLALRAAAEDERAASFARLSPPRLGMVTWVVSTVFASFVLIVAGPAVGVMTPGGLTVLVVPALAVALIGRLESLGAALLGALVLGVVQGELVFLANTKSWWPDWAKQGLTTVVPFAAIVVTLLVVGHALPTRGEDTRTALPAVLLPRNRPLAIVVVVGGAVVALCATSGSYRFGVVTSMASALIALSLVVLTGMVGQISLAQTAFAGMAGLVLSKLGTGVPFPLSLAIAVGIATAAGTLVGIPALRIRGAQLAVVTLAAAVAVQEFVFEGPQLVSYHALLIPPWRLGGLDLSVRAGRDVARLPFALFVLAVVAATFVLVGNLLRAGTGRKMLAVRSNERAAASVGIAVPVVKLGAFGLSSFLAGLGGALIAYSRGQLSSASFGLFVGIGFLAITYLSGITSQSGAVVAGALVALGIVYVVLDRTLGVAAYYALISGPALILTVIFNPLGLAGRTRVWWEGVRTGRRRPGRDSGERVGAPAPAAPPVVAGGRAIGDVVLQARGITVTYGGVRAVADLDLDVRAGEIVGLIGPNGAGKTSFVDAVTGFTPCGGVVHLDGAEISAAPPHVRARKGLVRTWQSVELFDDLSADDNVRVGSDSGRDVRRMLADLVRPNPPAPAAAREAIAVMELDDVVGRRPGELPVPEQKAVAVGRALALGPQVLLLDEPAAGLDAAHSAAFGDHLRRIAATGVGCLLVDHDMRLVLGVCDRIYVIEFGRTIAVGRPEEVRADPAVVAAYLGTDELSSYQVTTSGGPR
jgi:ABC-type branched-subunit amino acid transport system ATPase component/branched-subunit amino acid ABC-type transport system permease component